jgi:hypothetical protein
MKADIDLPFAGWNAGNPILTLWRVGCRYSAGKPSFKS